MLHVGSTSEAGVRMRGMRRFKADEDSISPVIATVLLLAITVTLTSVIIIMISGSITSAEKAAPLAEVSVSALDNGFQIVKFTSLNKHLDPDMVEFKLYNSTDPANGSITDFAGGADVYGRIGSTVAFHDRDALYTVNAGDYFIINATAAGSTDGNWHFRLFYFRSNSELAEVRLPAM